MSKPIIGYALMVDGNVFQIVKERKHIAKIMYTIPLDNGVHILPLYNTDNAVATDRIIGEDGKLSYVGLPVSDNVFLEIGKILSQSDIGGQISANAYAICDNALELIETVSIDLLMIKGKLCLKYGKPFRANLIKTYWYQAGEPVKNLSINPS